MAASRQIVMAARKSAAVPPFQCDVPGASREASTPQCPHRKELGNDKSGDLSGMDLEAGRHFASCRHSLSGCIGLVRPVGTQRAQAAEAVSAVWHDRMCHHHQQGIAS